MTAASYTLVFGLFVQTLVLTIYLQFRAPDVFQKYWVYEAIDTAGFMGAFASQFWLWRRADGCRQRTRRWSGAVRAGRGVPRSSSRCPRANCWASS